MQFLDFVEDSCLWFPEEGTINLKTWTKVGDRHYSGSSPVPTNENLFCATQRSAELDLSPISWYLLTPDLTVEVIPIRVYGPLPQGTVGLN
jgi:hypothetical protein